MKRYLTFLIFAIAALAMQAQTWANYTAKNSGLASNNILALATDSRGTVWVGTTQGLNRYSDGRWTDYADFNEKLKDQFVNCLIVEGNTLWIGTDDYGIIEFNNGNWYEHAEETHRLNMKYIRDIAIDYAGVKWIGVTLSGFVQYDGVNWNKYTATDSELLSDFILCVTVDKRDRKWIGTNDGLCVFDGRHWTSYTTKNSKMPHNIVLSLAIGKDNIKWIGTLEGLCRFDGENWQIFNTDNSPLPGNQINDLAFDGEGHLWVATDGGVAVFDGEKQWDVFSAGNQLPKCMCQNLAIDRSGTIWVGTDEKGLYALSGYTMAKPAAPAEELAVAEDPSGEASQAGNAGTGTAAKQAASSKGDEAQSDERIKLVPNLEEGYLVIQMLSPEAEVTFLNAKGEKVRTVPKYRNGGHINISKMKKGTYTVRVKTLSVTRTVKFTLR